MNQSEPLLGSQKLNNTVGGGTSFEANTYVNLKKTKWRFVVFYYVLYSLNSVQLEIQKVFEIDYVKYNLLTSIYGIPNVILCFISGNIIHKIGLRASNFYVVLMIFIGHLVVIISCFYSSYYLCLLGRLIVGFSVMALRIGAVIPDLIIPYVYTLTNSLVQSQLTGIGVCVVAQIFAILYNLIDRYNEKKLRQKKLQEQTSMGLTQIFEDEENIDWHSYKQLGKIFWAFSFLVILMYGTFQPFNSNLNSLIRERFGYDIVGAGQVIAFPTLLIALASPVFGIISDKYGHRGDILTFATFLLIIVQTTMGTLRNCEACVEIIYAIFVYQIAYSFFVSNIWASLKLITPKHLRGIAVGITNALQNVGYFFSSLLIGLILDGNQDKQLGYRWVNYLMAMMNLTGFVILISWNCKEREKLNAKKPSD
ncbi:major facilitator superfamily protein [Stylonychia lemnae]|uniref:Lysosomal dipeptide transporter MFSD1 n=1 Tax=Stylonychia lemnae TaxID=5949 RepID=A0A078B458_STYLE|nr:major facilitator superfamily protein [Stylonychia lemnae]|eukprot:CDW89264.1 major facilitator superfamily protein [Stylonychia lemnae]